MYQGKFDAKKKKANVEVSELVAQRRANPQPEYQPQLQQMPPKRPQQPRPAQAQPTPRKKQGPRLGGTIFYTLYFLFILAFFVATYFGLQWLQGWLVNYEIAQPTHKSEAVFQQLFENPDWGALYEAAGAEDSAYEGKEAYVAYMEEKVGGQALTMKATSGGLKGKRYNILLGSEKVASFTLVNHAGIETEGLSFDQSKLPDWQLDQVEIFFTRDETYYISAVTGHTVLVNDVALTDDNVIETVTTVGAEEYLPISVTGISTSTMEVSGLMGLPTVTVLDESGNAATLSYDEASHTFTEQTTANTITDEETEVVRKAIQTYSLYMVEKASNAELARCFDASSEIYNTLTHLGELWTQKMKSYEFKNESFTDYIRYTDDLFSIRASVELHVVPQANGDLKVFSINQSMFFRKQATGKWLCFEMTNKDVSSPVGKVRLTFMDGETKLDSQMYDTNSTKLSPPAVSVPEGKIFSGWYQKEVDENGKISYNMVFDPDENGNVTIPNGTTLKPMTLYALYEDRTTTEGA